MLKKLVSGAFAASVVSFFVSCALGFAWAFWWLVTALFMGGSRHLFNGPADNMDRCMYHFLFILLMAAPMAFFGWLEDALFGDED